MKQISASTASSQRSRNDDYFSSNAEIGSAGCIFGLDWLVEALAPLRYSTLALHSSALIHSHATETRMAQTNLSFQQLPREIRGHAAAVRNSCKEYEPSFEINSDMQGIEILSLKGDGTRDIIVDNEGLCATNWAGANCSNRACDMRIYKEVARGQWRKVFEESLHTKFLVIDYERMRLQMMVAAIYAGDPRCKPDPRKEYTSGMS